MFSQLVVAWLLMASNVVIHAYGVTQALRWVRRHAARPLQLKFGPSLFIRLAGWIVLLHVIEITVWAGVYELAGAMRTFNPLCTSAPSPIRRRDMGIWCCRKTGGWSARWKR